MANEISIGIQVDISQGYFKDSVHKSFRDDFPIIGKAGGIQVIGTTIEDLDFGDLTYEGWLYMENLDETNIIDYGPDSSGEMISCGRLDPGEACLWRLKPGVTIKARARNAECRLGIACWDTATST